MSDSDLSIVVAGAGIGGLTAATACARAGATVNVVELATQPEDSGAGIQLSPNAMHVLAALGLRNAIEKVAFAPERAVIRRYTTGKPLLKSELNPRHERIYGQKYLHVHRADLLSVLLEAAETAGVKLHFNTNAKGLEQQEKNVTLQCDSVSFSADLLIGADGIHSVVRQQLHGDSPARFTGQVAWRGLVPATALPAGLLTPDANVWVGPGKHFVAYYVRGGDLINFVAVREQELWAEESWQTRGDIAEVRNAFSGWDPLIEKLLSYCDSCFLWGLFDRPPLHTWYQGRVVMLGDAVHPMLPFMAQGAAMAIEDGWVLSQQVTQDRVPLQQALNRYQKRRKPRTRALHKMSSKNARTYHRSGPVSVALRDLSFAAGSAIPAVTDLVLNRIYGLDVTRMKH